VWLGYNNPGGSGTLNLGSSVLTIGNSLNIGRLIGGGIGTITGTFTVPTFNIQGNSLTFSPNDIVNSLNINNSTVGTVATGNVTGSVSAYDSTLNLGANMNLSGSLSASGSSIINTNGNNISASSLRFLSLHS
jgi:hypothetical protein